MKPLLLGCIADDFTGGTDLASTLVEGGMRTVQYLETPQGMETEEIDAAIIALKTRTCPKKQAVSKSLEALDSLNQFGCRQFFFKYCSTFDSTPQGNIGPVADALMQALGIRFSIVCPAFPTNRRTVYKGHLFVDDNLLSESSMRDHPLTPMTDANLVRYLGLQTNRKVCLIDHQNLQNGVDYLKKKLAALRDQFDGYAVMDAITDEDLHIIGEAASDLKLITGGSGVAIGLPANFKRAGLLDEKTHASKIPEVKGPSVILAGSCSTATNRQVTRWLSQGVGFKIDPLKLAGGEQQAEDLILKVLPYLNQGQSVMVYSSEKPERVRNVQAMLGVEHAGDLVENAMSAMAVRFYEKGIRRFIVAGGETAGAVVKALGVNALRIGSLIDPGVPWTSSLSSPHIVFALKSGNFGSEDFFIKTAGDAR